MYGKLKAQQPLEPAPEGLQLPELGANNKYISLAEATKTASKETLDQTDETKGGNVGEITNGTQSTFLNNV